MQAVQEGYEWTDTVDVPSAVHVAGLARQKSRSSNPVRPRAAAAAATTVSPEDTSTWLRQSVKESLEAAAALRDMVASADLILAEASEDDEGGGRGGGGGGGGSGNLLPFRSVAANVQDAPDPNSGGSDPSGKLALIDKYQFMSFITSPSPSDQSGMP